MWESLRIFKGEKESDVEKELNDVFNKSRRYRSRSRRNGAILIADSDDKIFNLLSFVVNRCNLDISIFHCKTLENAEGMINSMKAGKIRSIIVDNHLLESSGKQGEKFLNWLFEDKRNIPVWVNGKSDKYKDITEKLWIGFLDKTSMDEEDYFEAIGLPDVCSDCEIPLSFKIN